MDYLKINREAWDKRAKVHVDSEFYDVKGFLEGKTSLQEIELIELNDVKGKRLLHLQCHFGLDTMSWARKGAIVTGVDLSSVAINTANHIKRQANIDAKFICSDIYQFNDSEEEINYYDVVFTSYGAICWLPDLNKWAETIAKHLKPGGTFYMVEFHPVYDLVSDYSYFYLAEPVIDESGTYTENCSGEKTKLATWSHPLSNVVNSLIKAGIQINQLNEFPFSPYKCFDGLIEKESGRYYLDKFKYDMPLVFSILGEKR
ncbi:class I SAM-dependent methyltransferase [Spartinivicinus poritis]|uniref:Class I SAM-dependent methyltransferase n=1 Tax=Spartinivicinus poritis TaxID=2994640 RepID=A0ABT5U5M7_9GAMM|nr:class I SAM-dependent methyltransferase [Spartinivicinus sp. A2-2]MDE1461665.1 class I SAM-dependent methyltransferase [Spartinivicinus sp. A2-2]